MRGESEGATKRNKRHEFEISVMVLDTSMNPCWRLTFGGRHAEVPQGRVEKDQRQPLLVQLIGRRSEDSVSSRLEVTPGDDLQRLSDVDDQSARLIRDVIPLLVPAPNLETRDRDGEQQGGQSEIRMPVHPQPFRLFLCGLLHRTEQGVSEVSFAGGASVGLDVVPEVIIWQFKDAGEERQEATVDGLGQVLQRKNRIEIQSAGQLKVEDE